MGRREMLPERQYWLERLYYEDTFGSVFGVAMLMPGSRPRTFTWEPSSCDERGVTNMQFAWGNYKYRICLPCWYDISNWLWLRLSRCVRRRAALIIWEFLLEPAQH